MGSLKALLIAGAVISASSLSVHAADLLPPPPPLETPVDFGPADVGGWYLRADVGDGNAMSSNLRSSFTAAEPTDAQYNKSSIDNSAIIGGGVGYAYNNWMRFDITGEYRTNQLADSTESYQGDSGRDYDLYHASIQSSVFLANGYFDLGTWHCLTPYLGLGAGASYNRIYGLTDTGAGPDNGGAFGSAPSKSSFHFAWAAMAGFSYDITKSLKLDVGYRYLDMGRVRSAGIICTDSCSIESKNYHLASNDIRIGLRWMFNTPYAPVYDVPAGPIIRKY